MTETEATDAEPRDDEPQPERPSRRAAWQARFERARKTLVAWWERVRRQFPAVDLLWEFGHRYRRLNGSVLVGHLTYRGFLWLVPLTLVVVALVGYGRVGLVDSLEVASQLGVDEQFADDVSDQAAPSRLYALVIGLGGLLWATFGGIKSLHYVYAQIWEVEIRPRRRVVRAIAMVLSGTVVVLVVLGILTAAREQGLLLRVGGGAASFVVESLILLVIAWFLPRRTSSFFDLLPGSVLGGAALLVLHLFLSYYLPQRIEGASAVYGSLGAVVATLFGLFLFAQVLVGSAFVNTVWYDREEILAGRPWVTTPEHLPGWLRRMPDRMGDWRENVEDVPDRFADRWHRRRGDPPTDTPEPAEPRPADEDPRR